MYLHNDKLIKSLPKCYRLDKWVNELYKSSGMQLDEFKKALEDAFLQLNISTATWGLSMWEESLNIKTNLNQPIEERRAFIRSKWISDQKCDIKLIQSICDAWKNGKVTVEFKNKIILKFSGEYGVPSDINSLVGAIENIKPAQLMLEYIFSYIFVKDIKNMKIKDLQKQQIKNFARKQ